ncbi:NADH dehydrogenase [ubiquinone] 1 alpha subcomplex subunit 1 [Frankliniella fusca]|uniref:NADH dehydrogenase [ubiquinone] 1 alpha subcomplex subunit 1 n=1 Tax=Frankliniella fusca TaxID=407009 RepID=A0AAE1HKW1_9NEOP|nr:NADH dehydrogenase [ubiquinone] 1 alpha subcomplex subunit 1 [Frankliniella fusca]
MWWTILPSMIITSGLIYVPCVLTPVLGWIWTGCIDGRSRGSNYEQYLIFRDKRVLPPGEDPYRQQKHLGLDGVPDD